MPRWPDLEDSPAANSRHHQGIGDWRANRADAAVCREGFPKSNKFDAGSSRGASIAVPAPARRRLIRQHECGFVCPASQHENCMEQLTRDREPFNEPHQPGYQDAPLPDFGRRDRKALPRRATLGRTQRRSPSVAAAEELTGKAIFTHEGRKLFSPRRETVLFLCQIQLDFMTNCCPTGLPDIEDMSFSARRISTPHSCCLRSSRFFEKPSSVQIELNCRCRRRCRMCKRGEVISPW